MTFDEFRNLKFYANCDCGNGAFAYEDETHHCGKEVEPQVKEIYLALKERGHFDDK